MIDEADSEDFAALDNMRRRQYRACVDRSQMDSNPADELPEPQDDDEEDEE